jgi:hypothetical protein
VLASIDITAIAKMKKKRLDDARARAREGRSGTPRVRIPPLGDGPSMGPPPPPKRDLEKIDREREKNNEVRLAAVHLLLVL